MLNTLYSFFTKVFVDVPASCAPITIKRIFAIIKMCSWKRLKAIVAGYTQGATVLLPELAGEYPVLDSLARQILY